MKKISANLELNVVRELDRIAEETGKTRDRIILEACIEYLHRNANPDRWSIKHFQVDFNRFNKLRKKMMDLENKEINK